MSTKEETNMMNADRNYEVARQTCMNNRWRFNEDDEHHVLKMGFNVKTKFGHIDVIIHAKEHGIITYGILPIRGDSPINLYINSPGGSVTAGMAIYDTMQYIKAPVHTTCIGMAASMGAFLLMAGEKGKRCALPNSEVMIHQPLGGAQGQATDVQIRAEWLLRTKTKMLNMMASMTGQTIEKLQHDCERDYFMNAIEAKEYGCIDDIYCPEKRAAVV